MKNSKLANLLKGLIKENPVFVLLLGTCPTLAVTTSASNAIGMGLAATLVLICSNIAISALRKIILAGARESVFLFESYKCGKRMLHTLAYAKDVTAVITTEKPKE